MNLDILGIAETHWTGAGKIIQENHTMIYSGGEKHRNGVGIVMKNSVAKSMMGFWAISDRVIMMKLEAKPFNINVMQVYAPTLDHDGEEMEKFIKKFKMVLNMQSQMKLYIYIYIFIYLSIYLYI